LEEITHFLISIKIYDIEGGLTVCVTCVWAGVDSAWEQGKLEARKRLKMAQNPARRLHALLAGVFAKILTFSKLLTMRNKQVSD